MNDTLRILLIDDNPDDRTLVIRELRREFPSLQIEQIIEAKGFAQALEAGNFDLVVTDFQLRWTDGLAVLKAIKAHWPHCPVIMFTGTGSEVVAVEAMKAGLNDYVLKSPKHFARLPAAINLALEQSKQRQALQEAENRYRSLFDGVPVGLYRSTPSGHILDANAAMIKMLGYPDRESLMAVNMIHLYVSPQEQEQWQAIVEQKGVVKDFEVRLRRRDGTLIWAKNSASVARDENGEILYYEGALTA
jgi:PAS domain S-box-containing protein